MLCKASYNFPLYSGQGHGLSLHSFPTSVPTAHQLHVGSIFLVVAVGRSLGDSDRALCALGADGAVGWIRELWLRPREF